MYNVPLLPLSLNTAKGYYYLILAYKEIGAQKLPVRSWIKRQTQSLQSPKLALFPLHSVVWVVSNGREEKGLTGYMVPSGGEGEGPGRQQGDLPALTSLSFWWTWRRKALLSPNSAGYYRFTTGYVTQMPSASVPRFLKIKLTLSARQKEIIFDSPDAKTLYSCHVNRYSKCRGKQ